MHPEDIKAALKKKGQSQRSIAKRLDVSTSTVHNVIHGACKSERIAKVISGFVGKDRADIWPGRYVPAAERLIEAT